MLGEHIIKQNQLKGHGKSQQVKQNIYRIPQLILLFVSFGEKKIVLTKDGLFLVRTNKRREDWNMIIIHIFCSETRSYDSSHKAGLGKT